MSVDCEPTTGVSQLSYLAAKHGADKDMHHSYLPVYVGMMGWMQDYPATLLEIGVFKGGSLRMWLDWLPKARVIGIDVRLPVLEWAHEYGDRLETHLCSQDHERRLRELFPPNSLDVVIDDGSHFLEHQLLTLHYLWPALRDGGLYFIEDVQNEEHLDYFRFLPGCGIHDGRRTTGRYDDLLVSFRKIRP